MAAFLGFDTSNYTTSAALIDDGGKIFMRRQLLDVRPGEKGLRQSEALFQHVRELPKLVESLFGEAGAGGGQIAAVGASVRPRDEEGSYMPCFMAGEGSARAAAAALGVPFYGFSHQAGHIAAALYSTGQAALLRKPLLAFHVSGGTTEALLVSPGNRDERNLFSIRRVACSLDLKAGQAVDRCGLLLGLAFPCGPELEALALQSSRQYRIRPVLKGADCCLSGLENQCAELLQTGAPKEDVARFCLLYIRGTLDAMAAVLLREYPGLPLLFAGGVMSDSILRRHFEERYGAFFAAPGFSADNAAGIAALAKWRCEGL